MMKRILLASLMGAVFAPALAPSLAFAQPSTPEDWYKEGETQYNLGNFDKAVEAFKKGFELEPNESKKSAYLYNIAQSYRQAGDCTNAQFFYKRYLALKDNDTRKPLTPEKRQEIEGRIKDLDECAKAQEAARKPAVDNKPPDGGNTGGGGDGGNKPPEGGSVTEEPATSPPPKMISARLMGGVAKVNAGNLEVPVLATGALVGGYPLPLDERLVLEIGAGFTWTPVPYDRNVPDSTMTVTRTGQLFGLIANVGATYEVARKIGLRGDLGLGALVFSGISESPFTGDDPTTGPLTMFHLRLGASVEYAVTPNIVIAATPFTMSFSPAKKGLQERVNDMNKDIKRITAFDFMIGVGYRM
jgi:hypothetical protein